MQTIFKWMLMSIHCKCIHIFFPLFHRSWSVYIMQSLELVLFDINKNEWFIPYSNTCKKDVSRSERKHSLGVCQLVCECVCLLVHYSMHTWIFLFVFGYISLSVVIFFIRICWLLLLLWVVGMSTMKKSVDGENWELKQSIWIRYLFRKQQRPRKP